jgi:chondroitin AC lyase
MIDVRAVSAFSMPSLVRAGLAVSMVLAIAGPACAATSETIDTERIVKVISDKLKDYSDKDGSGRSLYPFQSDKQSGGAKWAGESIDTPHWIHGFYPGALWYAYEYARRHGLPNQKELQKIAGEWTIPLDKAKNWNTHDLGFLLYCSVGNAIRLTDDEPAKAAYNGILLNGAKTLSDRFISKTGMIRSWDTPTNPPMKGQNLNATTETVIVDSLMNLRLLLWAADNGKGISTFPLTDVELDGFRDKAISHADRSMMDGYFFRKNVGQEGSTYHVIDLKIESNPTEVLKRYANYQQGMSDESCWSRGQGWAIYGFAEMYEFTRDPKYLQQSISAADYYWNNLPDDFVPMADFQDERVDAQNKPLLEFRDSSTAAICASAFLRISRLSSDQALRRRFREMAVKSLGSLTSSKYFSASAAPSPLLYQARTYVSSDALKADPQKQTLNTNSCYIWGDYYLLEALLAYDESLMAPVVASQLSDHTVNAGETASWSVVMAADPWPLTYQWQQAAPGSEVWKDVGTNSPSYSIAGTTPAESGVRVRVQVKREGAEVMSSVAALVVKDSPPPAPVDNRTEDKSTCGIGNGVGCFLLFMTMSLLMRAGGWRASRPPSL